MSKKANHSILPKPEHLPGEIFALCPLLPEGYMISNMGRVLSKGRITVKRSGQLMPVRERILINTIDSKGYFRVYLIINNIKRALAIHRLVALAFLPNPENKVTVNHKDGVKTNNYLENLEWATYSENNSHAFARGLRKSASMAGVKRPRRHAAIIGDGTKVFRRGEGIGLHLISMTLPADKSEHLLSYLKAYKP